MSMEKRDESSTIGKNHTVRQNMLWYCLVVLSRDKWNADVLWCTLAPVELQRFTFSILMDIHYWKGNWMHSLNSLQGSLLAKFGRWLWNDDSFMRSLECVILYRVLNSSKCIAMLALQHGGEAKLVPYHVLWLLSFGNQHEARTFWSCLVPYPRIDIRSDLSFFRSVISCFY